ncbi:TPA: hypothetical protein J9703_003819 [Escherichia coli]|nr:hypothetical protein [Escherichia coli]
MSRKSYPNVNAANQYARDVVRGKIAACQFVIQACQRHLDDLMAEKSKSFRYRFDKDLAERAAKFIQLLPHTKGEWAFKRMPITLEPWQLFVICCAFGWVNKGSRLRRFREVYTEIPRKNGKSAISAGVALYCFACDTRGNPQTGTPATDLDDDYFDMLQEELCSVVEASGASLEKGRHDQLLTALRALLLSRKNPFGDIKSDGTVKTALENLGLGEAAKRNVGTGENQIPDMSSYASGSGWRKMPDGSIEQWGRISFPGEHGPVSANVSFPIPFTQTPGIVIVCDGGFGGGNMWGATNWSTTGFIAHCNYGLEGGAFFAKGW